MTSTNRQLGGVRKEVDYQKLGPALLIASSLVLAIRTARWPATLSDGLAEVDWQKEVEHTARIAKTMLIHLTSRFPTQFTSRDVPWYEATDIDVRRYTQRFSLSLLSKLFSLSGVFRNESV